MTDIRKLTTGEARENFADVINAAGYGAQRVVLTRHGKEVAAVVPISDLELLHQLERIIDLEEARKALIEAGEAGATPLDVLKKELGL